MPILSGDQTLLRKGRHMGRYWFNIWPEAVVATADINEDSTIKYPTHKLKVTNTSGWDDIKVGMRFVVTNDSGEVVTTGVVRAEPNADTLFIDAKSSGDTGWVSNNAVLIENDQTVTVYNDYPLWTVFSRIKDGVFYKQWNLAYTDQGSNPDPVCNIGTWRQEFVDTSLDEATVTMSATNSYAWNSKTITDYLWTLPAEATITAGTVTSSSITFTLPVGFYLVECEITDSGGASTVGVRPIWVNTKSGDDAPTSSKVVWQITSDDMDLNGRKKTLSIRENAALTETYYKGAGFLFTEEAYYGTSYAELSEGVLMDKFVGFSVQDTETGKYKDTELTIEIEGPYRVFAQLPQVSQVILERATPNSWLKVARGLGTPDFLFWYIVYYHVPNALKLFDYYKLPEASPPRRKRYGLSGTTIQSQTEEVASYISGNIGSSSDGAFYFFRDPFIENTAFRDLLDEKMTITANDISSPPLFTNTYRPSIGQLTAYGFILNTTTNKVTAVGSLAPGDGQPQSDGRSQSESLLVTSQTDLNQRSGNLYARENAIRDEIVLEMLGNFDIFDPVKQFNSLWRLQFTGDILPRGVADEARYICVGVSRTYSEVSDGSYAIKKVSPRFRVETTGLPGKTISMETGSVGPDNNSLNDPEIVIGDLQFFNGLAFAWDGTALGRTQNFREDEPNWVDIKGDIVGTIADFSIVPYSSFITNGYSAGKLEGYAISTSSTDLNIYKCLDLMQTEPTWTLIQQYTMNDAGPVTSPKLIVNRDVPGIICVGWRDQTATFVAWSDDFGDSWSASPVQVGDETDPDATNDDLPFGIVMDGSSTITVGRDDADGLYYTYMATAVDGSFTKITDSEDGNIPNPFMKVSGADIYTATLDRDDTTEYTTPDWCKYWRMRVQDEGNDWSRIVGEYVYDGFSSSNGWVGQDTGLPPTYPQRWNEVTISIGWGPFARNVTRVISKIDRVEGDATTGSRPAYRLYYTNSKNSFYVAQSLSYTDVPNGHYDAIWYSLPGLNFLSGAAVMAESGFQDGGIYPADPADGTARIISIYMEGTGTSPFSNSSCAGSFPIFGLTNAVWHVDDYAGTPVWTAINPDNQVDAPRHFNSLVIDGIDPTLVYLLYNDESYATTVYSAISPSDPMDWTEEAYLEGELLGMKVTGNFVLSWGDGIINYSESGVAGLFVSKIGSWEDTIGELGVVAGVQALI